MDRQPPLGIIGGIPIFLSGLQGVVRLALTATPATVTTRGSLPLSGRFGETQTNTVPGGQRRGPIGSPTYGGNPKRDYASGKRASGASRSQQ